MSTINPNSYTNPYANLALTQLKSSQSSQANDPTSMAASGPAVSQDTVTLSSSAPVARADTYSHLAPNAKQGYTGNVQAIAGNPESDKSTDKLAEAMQTILDKRTGIDREKLKQLEAEMEKIANDENLSEEEKAKQLELLQAQKMDLIKESSEKNEQRQRSVDPEVYYS